MKKNRINERCKGIMQTTIEYLIKNPDILEKIKNGEASLLGLSEKQRVAINETFKKGYTSVLRSLQYW
jgi:competence protein ComX